MISEECGVCKKVLTSALEIDAGVCAVCIPKLVKERFELVEDKKASTARIVELTKDLDEVKVKLKRYDELRRAEVEGIEAARMGVGEDQNLYQNVNDADLNTMWLAGHAQGKAARDIQTLEAVLLWTSNNLLSTAEIASGEVKDRIVTVSDKLLKYFKADG